MYILIGLSIGMEVGILTNQMILLKTKFEETPEEDEFFWGTKLMQAFPEVTIFLEDFDSEKEEGNVYIETDGLDAETIEAITGHESVIEQLI